MRRARMGTLPGTYASPTLLEDLKRQNQQLTPELRGAIREVLLEFAACVHDGQSPIAQLCQEGISGHNVPPGQLSLAVPEWSTRK